MPGLAKLAHYGTQILISHAKTAGVATTPYGTLPAAPQVGGGEAFPEHRVGLTQRPLGPMVGRSVMRPTALLTPRSITPRAGVRLRTPRPRSISRCVELELLEALHDEPAFMHESACGHRSGL